MNKLTEQEIQAARANFPGVSRITVEEIAAYGLREREAGYKAGAEATKKEAREAYEPMLAIEREKEREVCIKDICQQCTIGIPLKQFESGLAHVNTLPCKALAIHKRLAAAIERKSNAERLEPSKPVTEQNDWEWWFDQTNRAELIARIRKFSAQREFSAEKE